MDPEIRLKFHTPAHDYLHPTYPNGTPSSFCSGIIYINIEKGLKDSNHMVRIEAQLQSQFLFNLIVQYKKSHLNECVHWWF